MINMAVNSLTPDSAIKLARRYGVEFTKEEAEILLPFIRRHKNDLVKENKTKLLNEVKGVVSSTTYSKISRLVNKFIQIEKGVDRFLLINSFNYAFNLSPCFLVLSFSYGYLS